MVQGRLCSAEQLRKLNGKLSCSDEVDYITVTKGELFQK
jgi:hypothetical protein